MDKKTRRQNRIRELIKRESRPLTVTELYRMLVIQVEGDLSRKTVERDVDEMISRREIKQASEAPLRLVIGDVRVRTYLLSDEEVKFIVESIKIINGIDCSPIVASIIIKLETG